MIAKNFKAIQKILAILLISILAMSDFVVIAENMSVVELSFNELTEETLLEVNLKLITNQVYKQQEDMKKVIQFEVEIDAGEIENSSLKQNEVNIVTPIQGVEPEEIYVSEKISANFVESSWGYENGNLKLILENEGIEKNKEQNKDIIIVTYVYDETTDVSSISSKISAVGKLYNGAKVTSNEVVYEVENNEILGNLVQIEAEMQEIYRTNLLQENQEFVENINVNLSYKNLEILDKLTLADSIISGYSDETQIEIEEKYKTTIINKSELLNAIGENGNLVIKNNEEIIAQIDKDTETNENGYIVVNFEEEISKITIEVNLSENAKIEDKIENGRFNIINIKEIAKNENADILDKQMKLINVSLGENVGEFIVVSTGEIKNKVTKADFGINKSEIPSNAETEIIATITMHAENTKYDLNKNPRYEIVLPKEIENIEIGNISILNNKDFLIEKKAIEENDNGQKVLVIKLQGEQTEYVEEAGNVQVVVPMMVKTKNLIPTVEDKIELYYTNEKAESYGADLDFGKEEIQIEIFSETDLIVAQEAKTENENAISYKTEIGEIKLKGAEVAQIVSIKGTVVNNIKEVEENIVIIGQNELLAEITPSKGSVYYSETMEGPWADNFSEGQKYFKIEIEKLEIGETLEFTYNMQIPNNLEESTQYEVIYKVKSNDEIRKESKLFVSVEVEKKQEPDLEEIEIKYETRIEDIGGFELQNAEIDSNIFHKIFIRNNSSVEKDAVITIKNPECVSGSSLVASIYEETDIIYEETEEKIYSFIDYLEPTTIENISTYQVKVPAQKEIIINLGFCVKQYVTKEVKTDIEVVVDDKKENFTDVKKAIKPANIISNIRAYINEKEIKSEEVTLNVEDTIKYVAKITNTGETSKNIRIENENISGFMRKQMLFYKNGELIKEYAESDSDIFCTDNIELAQNDILDIILIVELTEEVAEDRIIENYLEILGHNLNLTTDIIKLKLLKKQDIEPEQPLEPENSENPKEPVGPEEKIYKISGLAWLDKNKNGAREETEDYLKGVEVTLKSVETNSNIFTTITNIDGEYEFKNLKEGKYIVIFGYNSTTYNLAEYKKSGIDEDKNSDAILTSQNGINIAKTEVINVTKDIKNIDIGFVLKESFDLEVRKYIKKITLKNGEGQTVYEYNNSELAKIEIPSKYFKGTNIIIEYEVQIENKGDIPGYVITLTDNKPAGLKFASELNTSWYEALDNKLYCIEFGEDEILPGEIRKIDLVLTKEITDIKIQYITNEVELEDIFNENLEKEKDISNNKAEASLIVTIKTGDATTYIGLWLACAIIIGSGVYLVKRNVIQKR